MADTVALSDGDYELKDNSLWLDVEQVSLHIWVDNNDQLNVDVYEKDRIDLRPVAELIVPCK